MYVIGDWLKEIIPGRARIGKQRKQNDQSMVISWIKTKI